MFEFLRSYDIHKKKLAMIKNKLKLNSSEILSNNINNREKRNKHREFYNNGCFKYYYEFSFLKF